jgi:hypothetical protein
MSWNWVNDEYVSEGNRSLLLQWKQINYQFNMSWNWVNDEYVSEGNRSLLHAKVISMCVPYIPFYEYEDDAIQAGEAASGPMHDVLTTPLQRSTASCPWPRPTCPHHISSLLNAISFLWQRLCTKMETLWGGEMQNIPQGCHQAQPSRSHRHPPQHWIYPAPGDTYVPPFKMHMHEFDPDLP